MDIVTTEHYLDHQRTEWQVEQEQREIRRQKRAAYGVLEDAGAHDLMPYVFAAEDMRWLA